MRPLKSKAMSKPALTVGAASSNYQYFTYKLNIQISHLPVAAYLRAFVYNVIWYSHVKVQGTLGI